MLFLLSLVGEGGAGFPICEHTRDIFVGKVYNSGRAVGSEVANVTSMDGG